MKFANLHLHSTYSDAQFTPEQLVLIGKSLGYRALALTDHETDSGVRGFMIHARQEGIDAITGVEFYGLDGTSNLHLTALDFDPEHPGIRAFIEQRCRLQSEYTRKCMDRGIQLGYIEGLTWNDVLDFSPANAWLCIDSVMQVMKIKKLVPEDYDWDSFRKNVFKGPEAKSFKQPYPTAEEVIRVVRDAGGVIALAHPNDVTHLVPRLVEYGLNGIEVSHPNLREDQTDLAAQAAQEYGLYICGGTDHTGPMSGCSGKNAIPVFNGITEEEYVTLKERRLG